MFNLSRKMKRMLAVVLVETIVATNVFVSYAEEDHSIMCQMTVEEADAAAAEQEQKNEEVSVPQVTENSETENTEVEVQEQEPAVIETPAEEPEETEVPVAEIPEDTAEDQEAVEAADGEEIQAEEAAPAESAEPAQEEQEETTAPVPEQTESSAEEQTQNTDNKDSNNNNGDTTESEAQTLEAEESEPATVAIPSETPAAIAEATEQPTEIPAVTEVEEKTEATPEVTEAATASPEVKSKKVELSKNMTDEEKVEALDGYFAEEGEEVTAMRKFGPLTLFNVGKTVNTEEGKSAQELLEEINRITGDYSIYTDELDLNGHMQADIAAEILNVKNANEVGSDTVYDEIDQDCYLGEININEECVLDFGSAAGKIELGNEVVYTDEDGNEHMKYTYKDADGNYLTKYTDKNGKEYTAAGGRVLVVKTDSEGNEMVFYMQKDGGTSVDGKSDLDISDRKEDISGNLDAIAIAAMELAKMKDSEGVKSDLSMSHENGQKGIIDTRDSSAEVTVVNITMAQENGKTNFKDENGNSNDNQADRLQIYTNDDQICIINVNISDATEETIIDLQKYMINGASADGSDTNGEAAQKYADKIVWNFGNYTGTVNITGSIIGRIIAPLAKVVSNATSTGSAVSKKFEVGIGEWHSTSKATPTPKVTETPTPTPKETATPTATPTGNTNGNGDADSDTNGNADGDTNSNPNSNADSDTNGNADGNTNRNADSDTNGNADGNTNGDPDSDADGDTNRDPNSNADGDTNRNPDGDANRNTDGNTDRNADGDANRNTDGNTDRNTDGNTDRNAK